MRLVSHLRRFGLPTLRELAGETLLKAVEGCAPSEQESQLAEIIHLRYGTKILEVKEIRKCLIDALSEAEGVELGRLAGISGSSHIQRSQSLLKHFAIYSTEKSQQLSTFLGLPPAY